MYIELLLKKAFRWCRTNDESAKKNLADSRCPSGQNRRWNSL